MGAPGEENRTSGCRPPAHRHSFTPAEPHYPPPKKKPTGYAGQHQFWITVAACRSLGAARLSDLSDLSDDGRAAKNNHSGKLPEQETTPGCALPTQPPRVNLTCSHGSLPIRPIAAYSAYCPVLPIKPASPIGHQAQHPRYSKPHRHITTTTNHPRGKTTPTQAHR